MKQINERPRASELGAALKAARQALELANGNSRVEREEWHVAFTKDAEAAQKEGRVYALQSPPGPARIAHDVRWDMYRAELRVAIQTLEFALGKRAEMPMFTVKAAQ